MAKTHPCRLCGNPVPARYVYHSTCLADVRRSFPYRDTALRRDGYNCAKCPQLWNRAINTAADKTGTRRRVEVDHIVPLGAGGPNVATNLQVLCRRHHRAKTRIDMARMKGRKPPRVYRQHPIAFAVAAVALLYAAARIIDALMSLNIPHPGHVNLNLLTPTPEHLHDPVWRWGAIGVFVAACAAYGQLRSPSRKRTRDTDNSRIPNPRSWRRNVIRTRLWEATVAVTEDSTAHMRRALKTRHWKWERTGTLTVRHTPTVITLRYPRTFPDHDPKKRGDLEDRVAAKMGGSWYASWDTAADTVTLRTPDPLVELGGLPWPLAGAPRLSLWDPIPVGVNEAGEPVTVTLPYSNMLIGGEPGAGKSVAQSLITAAAALDPHTVLYGIDGKGYVEQGIWDPCMDKLVGSGPTGHDDATALIHELRALMDARYELLFDAGKRKIAREDADRDDGQHLHVLIIDELAVFTSGGTKKQQTDFTEALRDLISRGRAAGIIVVAATQRPSADVVPTQIRDLIGLRWAMRCTTPQSSDMVLGQGQASAGYSASRVAAATRGIGFLLSEGELPVRLRSYLVDDAMLTGLAERAARSNRRRGADAPTA